MRSSNTFGRLDRPLLGPGALLQSIDRASRLCAIGRAIAVLCAAAIVGLSASVGGAQTPEAAPESTPEAVLEESAEREPVEYGALETAPANRSDKRVAVLPFRVNSTGSLRFLSGPLDELLAQRIEAGGEVSAIARPGLTKAGETEIPDANQNDAALRAWAAQRALDGVVVGSLTELAGRFSIDVRVVPTALGGSSASLVLTAGSDRELLDRLGELAERVAASVVGGKSDRIVEIRLDGAEGIEGDLRGRLTLEKGDTLDAAKVETERRAIATDPRVARVVARTQQNPDGVVVVFEVVQAERLLGESVKQAKGPVVTEVSVRGNKRIDEAEIRTRIQTTAGQPLDAARIARDVRSIFQQGFYRDIQVYVDETPLGASVVFEVVENPVVREIAISGNDAIEGDKIKEQLTLTTGSPLDYPLVHENVERITAMYKSEGYYLAEVDYETEDITDGSVAVTFVVKEKEKLKLRKILFEGNKAFSNRELRKGFTTKPWRFYSFASSWLDKTGRYSEPVFVRDLRLIEKLYTDNGYLQSRVIGPKVDPRKEGLFVTVEIEEGPQFRVGKLDVQGDETIDLSVVREKIQLKEGEIFSRSDLTADVETLESHFTDRGFYFANVEPVIHTNQKELTVDVDFGLQKGPLYFVRNIEIKGNSRTVDHVIRREVRLVEGQLYSARALQVSNDRIKYLGFFEDASFEPKTTDDPSQLDLDVNVVERPTGAFSFGAGFSSVDNFIFTASLSQSNLFGRGYGANLSADVGGRSSRYYISLSDPYFLGSTFSFGGTAYLTQIRYNSFKQQQEGIDLNVGHPLSEDRRASVGLSYGYSQRTVRQNASLNALAAPITRQVLQGSQSTSRLGFSLGVDRRNDRYAPTAGYAANLFVEYAGLGGFSNFLSVEGQAGYYFGAPKWFAPRWLWDRLTFVASTRMGYALPLNAIQDFQTGIKSATVCANPGDCTNVAALEKIDDDIRLPLTERYFMGGLGVTRLRGFQGRSVGPRRPMLSFTDLASGRVYHPVGTRLISQLGKTTAICDDTSLSTTAGNRNGLCNKLGDKNFNDFADISETQVIGGSSFISSSFEIRRPISEEIGLIGIAFVDLGNAFAEGELLFDVTQWRYGTGGGVLWFSPFGPLQLVLGFPIDPRPNEQSPVFEFSVGGQGI